jgi:hypothetical protein
LRAGDIEIVPPIAEAVLAGWRASPRRGDARQPDHELMK